jgi:PAS domain-containing serine/threonine kinase
MPNPCKNSSIYTQPKSIVFSSWKKFNEKPENRDEKIISLNQRLTNNLLTDPRITQFHGIQQEGINDSFECNQSFPKIKYHCNKKKKNESSEILNCLTPIRQAKKVVQRKTINKMDKIRLDGFNGLRFTPFKSKGCFTPNSATPYSCSLFNTKCGINPNKAVFTIDSKTSSILIVNKNACNLLGYSSRELCDSNVKFSNLLACKNKVHVSALAENQFNSEDGTMVLLSGKVVEMIHKNGDKIPVSLWIRHIDGHDGRCLAVAEVVERKIAQLIIDINGIVMSGDNEALMLFQLDSLEKFVGLDITVLIPAIQLPDDSPTIPKHVRKQRATGKTQDGVSFPLCLIITHQNHNSHNSHNNESNDDEGGYIVTIWVYSNISGLIVIDENSIIESCNHHFSTLMFGYSQSKIIGQNIFKLIPNFGQEFEYIDTRNPISPSIENEESETETDHILMSDPFISRAQPTVIPRICPKEFKICLDFTSSSHSSLKSEGTYEKLYSENDRNVANYSTDDDTNELLTPVNEDPKDSLTSQNIEEMQQQNNSNSNSKSYTEATTPNNSNNSDHQMTTKATTNNINITTSTPDIRKRSSICMDSKLMKYQSPSSQQVNIQQFNYNYVDGKYKGEAIHADGNIIDIVYTINKHHLISSNSAIYLIWLSRDHASLCVNEDEEADEKQFNLTLTLNSLTSTIDNSVGGMKNNISTSCMSNATSLMTSATAGTNTLANITSSQASRPNSLSIISQCEDEQVSGEYAKNYTTLKQIGKGAYGYVKMAYRNSDRLLVISKFILKEKLCPNFMITTDDKKEIPMEIYLLSRVKHPNIVSVLDVYENDKFFQLIMEKHGSGMDLFEFIDRRPLMDEKLGCYIFRQIANAVDYLHTLNILHRDIKDENIIIDQHFHIKLIDFGSATFLQEGKMFSTFYGTTEYCSPEVLAGNKYQGPELEMWSLGVTLYVLMFFENPFLDMEDTLRAELLFPQDVSVGLENLLLRMLEKDPKLRLSMKELLAHEWIIQEIVNNFNFPSIVPCTESEANPEVYYSGQFAAYSSATALSTSHDSLSLADDSIVDVCDDNDDLKCDYEDHLTRVNQNLNELNLINKDDASMSRSLQISNRSKTGKNSLKIAQVDVTQLQKEHQNVDLSLLGGQNFRETKISSACNNVYDNFLSVHNAHYQNPSNNSSNSPISPINPLTTSKSENNIFDKNISVNSSQFNVVSLSDLSDDAQYVSAEDNGTHQWNDLSKMQVLNQLSDEKIDGNLVDRF